MRSAPGTAPRPSPRAAGLAVLAAIGVGFALRLPGVWTDFWLDEVWSLDLAAGLGSALGVFTEIHHSNNHHLNTLLLYALGEREHWAVYRIAALVTGTASIALAAGIAARRGRLEAVLAAWLVAGSFALIHFSSEARGSGPTVAFALAALWLLECDLEQPRTWRALAFGLCVVAGFLFQLVFLFFWAGALAYTARQLWRRSPSPAARLLGLARLHAAPLLALAALWWIDLRHLAVGGGEPLDVAWLTARTLGFGFGLPVVPALALPGALLAGALAVGALWCLARRGDPVWLPIGVASFAAPAAAIAWLRPDVLAVRYFLTAIALLLLLAALSLAPALRRGGLARGAAVAALALFALGNGLHWAAFLEHGRGGYAAALERMARDTPDGAIQVGSDHDFRVGRVLVFHARRLADPGRLDYVPARRWPADGPDWLVLSRQERTQPPRTSVSVRGARYHLVAEYDHAAISGYYWMLYRNARAARPER